MADFIWLGSVDGDIGNLKNWHDATANIAATRTPGQNVDDPDNIWFVKTSSVRALTGSLTTGIANCYWLATAETNVQIGAVGNQHGIQGQYSVSCIINCNDMMAGYSIASGKTVNVNGFAADRVTFQSSSVITVANEAYLNSGTYKGTIIAGDLNIGNSTNVDSFDGSTGTFKIRAGNANRTVQPYQTEELSILIIEDTPQQVIIKNDTSAKLTAVSITTATGDLQIVGDMPMSSSGTLTQNGGQINKTTNGSTLDSFTVTASQKYALITASPSQSSISTLACSNFVMQGELSMGGMLDISTSLVAASAHGGSTNPAVYTAWFSGTITDINTASSGRILSTNSDTTKYINVYAKATTEFSCIGLAFNAGILGINNDTKAEFLGPFGMPLPTSTWTGSIKFDQKNGTLGGFILRNPSDTTETGLILKYSGASTVGGNALIVDDIDTTTPIEIDWNTTNATYNFTYSGSGVPYKFVDLTLRQQGTISANFSEVVQISGDLTITGGVFNCDDTFLIDKVGTATVTCSAETTLAPTLTIGVAGSATVCNYNWTSTATEYPILSITADSTLKPTVITTGAKSISGSGTFDWNGGVAASNMLFYITKSTGTPISNSLTFSNANYLTGYRTVFRYDVRVSSSYSITLPTAVSGDIELGSDGSPGLALNNDPIYNCPSACVITGNLTIDFSEYTNLSLYNAKVLVASATNELQVTGNVTIGAKGYCAAKVKVTNGNFTNTGNLISSKLSLLSSTGGTYLASCGTNCTVSDLLIDGQGLTSIHKISGSPTLSGTYTITDAAVSLADAAQTTAQSIVVTGAASCTPNKHLFVLLGGGTINDSSTETTSVAGLSFVGCNSLGAIKFTSGTTGIVGSVVADSFIINGGTVSQASGTGKKLWLRGGTHPTALANGLPGYKGGANFSNVAVNAQNGSFIFPTTAGSNQLDVTDTLVIGNGTATELHCYKNATLIIGSNGDNYHDTRTIVKWNSSKGIGFGPNSGWSGTFSLNRCDIEGIVNMSESLINTDSFHLISVAKLITINKNKVHSTKAMSILTVDKAALFNIQMAHNRFSAAANGVLIFNGNDVCNTTSRIQYNHFRSVGTSGTIVRLNTKYSTKYFFQYNTITSDTMTSGNGLLLGDTATELNPNYVLVTTAATPIDYAISSGFSHQRNIMLTAWYLDENNSNFGKACQGKTNRSLTSRFTNEQVNNKYITSGHRTHSDKTLVQFEDYTKWTQTSGSAPLVTKVQSNVVYRFARAEAKSIDSKEFWIGGTGQTVTWAEYDAVNPIVVTAKYYDGRTTTTETVTNGTALTIPASCVRLHFTVTLGANEGFGNFKMVDNKGRVTFSDDLSTNHGTQTAARHEVGPISGLGYGGINTSSAVVPHVTTQYNDPISQEVWLYLRRTILNNGEELRWVALLGEQDSNDFYRFTVHQQSSGTNNDILTIDKSVSGTVTTLVTKTDCNFTSGDSDTDVIMKCLFEPAADKLTLSIEGTTTTDWTFSVTHGDTSFNTGYWGWAVDASGSNSNVLKAEVYDGKETTQIFMNGMAITFMPQSSWKFPTSITNVELRDVTINGDQLSLMPNLYGTHATSVNNVTFFATTLPTSITNLVVIKNSTLTVSGDVTLSGNGQLHLIGCTIQPGSIRWKFNFDGITYTDSPPLLLQGNLLAGMHTTVTPIDESLFVVDDSARNTAVVRIQSIKDMNITRNAVLGLNYERMVFNGYDSKTVIITVQSVNNAGIIGKFEEMFMNQTLFELVNPYCHLWKAKIVGFTPRIMNNQANALQAIITVEEWRDD